jgi:hypothetical protein
MAETAEYQVLALGRQRIEHEPNRCRHGSLAGAMSGGENVAFARLDHACRRLASGP